MSDIHSLLVLPHLRVQNANAISSPMTWGFPSMSAFIGLMQALERQLPDTIDLEFEEVGVICHHAEAQTTRNGFTRAFRLTRNPVDKDGSTAAIVEEGRIHLELTLVFAVRGDICVGTQEDRDAVAHQVADRVAAMRIAGGSVTPPLPGQVVRQRPMLISLGENAEDRDRQFKRLRRRWLPGFALVLRDDLLQARVAKLRLKDRNATALEAWLDSSRLNHVCQRIATTDDEGNTHETVSWDIRRPPGWIVPIPVGYGALSELYAPGEVANARDATTPFRFVESLYSLGQWISPHRLERPQDLLWYVDNDLEAGRYRLQNDYRHRTAHVE